MVVLDNICIAFLYVASNLFVRCNVAGVYYDTEKYDMYDDYYQLDHTFSVSACIRGTDCTDCGGVDAIVVGDQGGDVDGGGEKEEGGDVDGELLCSDTCLYAGNRICDDPRGGNYCPLGTDCADCGSVMSTYMGETGIGTGTGAGVGSEISEGGSVDLPGDDDRWNSDADTDTVKHFVAMVESWVYVTGVCLAAIGLALYVRTYFDYYF